MTDPYRVAVVLDREFGSRLGELAKRLHVWLIDSPLNRAAAEAVWLSRSDQEHNIERGATIFNCALDKAVDDALVDIIGTVDEHHGEYSHDPPWTVIEVIGCYPTARVRRALADFGAKVADEWSDGFEARRTIRGAA